MASLIQSRIRQRWLASPIGVWGKLPSHGDFLRHNTTAAQAQDWQDWVSRVWSQRPASKAEQRRQAASRAQPGWVSLSPRKAVADLADVPVAFVMQPGAMPFAPKHCVQGVVVASSDQVGRPCPLVFFQSMAPSWLRHTWGQRKAAQGHDDILYWLARIAARTHAADQSWDALVRTVDALWQLHQPNWRHLMGAPLPAPTGLQRDALVRQYCALDTADAAHGLKGVQRMPWPQWPLQIVRADKPTHAYWQQDMRGGYVSASDQLPKLWGAPK
jgi:hypothetical protein